MRRDKRSKGGRGSARGFFPAGSHFRLDWFPVAVVFSLFLLFSFCSFAAVDHAFRESRMPFRAAVCVIRKPYCPWSSHMINELRLFPLMFTWRTGSSTADCRSRRLFSCFAIDREKRKKKDSTFHCTSVVKIERRNFKPFYYVSMTQSKETRAGILRSYWTYTGHYWNWTLLESELLDVSR